MYSLYIYIRDIQTDRAILVASTRRRTRESLEQATAPLLTTAVSSSYRTAYIPRDRNVTAPYTRGDDGSSDDGVGRYSQSDEAESTDHDNDEPVLDGEVLHGENMRLKQELYDLRDRLNQAKTELAFQQSRRPRHNEEKYFKEQLDGLRGRIRRWCITYFDNSRSYWTLPAERKFKLLSNDWVAYMTNRDQRPWLIQARVWYALDQLLFDPASTKRTAWLFAGQETGISIDRMFAQGQSCHHTLVHGH
jgi:hypothetical protein